MIEATAGHKTCVVYGALPPEMRRLQAQLFNDPESDYKVRSFSACSSFQNSHCSYRLASSFGHMAIGARVIGQAATTALLTSLGP